MSKKNKQQWQKYISVVVLFVIGVICGILMVRHMESINEMDQSLGESLLSLAPLILLMYVAIFLQIIIHEFGHLVFGLLTGYRYSSFRIGSFIWVKSNDKLKFKRLSIAGMGGQCLMAPPDIKQNKIPFVMYNLGGTLFNVFSTFLFLGLFLPFKNVPYLSIFLLMGAIIGIAFALLNGIPMKLGFVNNDGYNILSLSRNTDALYSFWLQMKVHEHMAKGERLKDMPEEWFEVPSPDAMKNSIVAVRGVFACNRIMDTQNFKEANQSIKNLLQLESGIVDIYRRLLICDRIYCELILGNKTDTVNELLDKDQKKFMKLMKNFPSVIRTEYTYALLAKNDYQTANKYKELFEKNAKKYPYPSDIESERELMKIGDGS